MAVNPIARPITARRTNRNPYEERIPDEGALGRLTAIAGGQGVYGMVESDPERVAPLRDLVWRAWDLEMRTPGAVEETYGWLRFGRQDLARHGDGLPQHDAYLSVLREAMARDTLDPVGITFGTKTGQLWHSDDEGTSWRLITGDLPEIWAVEAAVVD